MTRFITLREKDSISVGHSFSYARSNWRDEFAALEESAPEICTSRITGAAEEAANFTFSIYRGVAVRDEGNVVNGWAYTSILRKGNVCQPYFSLNVEYLTRNAG